MGLPEPVGLTMLPHSFYPSVMLFGLPGTFHTSFWIKITLCLWQPFLKSSVTLSIMIRTVMRYFLSLAFLVCLFSCTENRNVRTIFDQAESIMSTVPDSALAMIRSIDGQSLSTKGLRARHALLLTIAQDKCYLDVREDSTIMVAYDYYKRHGEMKDRLLATYYLGVVRQNSEDNINAALAFREAEPLAEDLEDYRQLSLIKQHLSHIYALNNDHVRALEYAEKAVRAAELAGESLMADYCRADIAIQLLSSYRYEEAETVLQQILDSNDENSELFSYAAKRMAQCLLYRNNPDIVNAKSLYLDAQQKNKTPFNSHDYGVLALICEKESDTYRADEYLQIAKRMIRSSADSAFFYNDCRNVFDERGDWEKAHKAKTESVKIQDRITIDMLGQSLSHSMEKYFETKWAVEEERSRSRLFMFLYFGSVVFVSFIVLIIVLRKRNQRIMDDMASIQDISSDLVDTLIADKVRSLQHLSESFFSWEDNAIVKREKKQGKQSKDELISSFRTQLNQLRNDHSIISTLEQSLDLTDDGIMKKARQHLKNEKELDYSVLTLLFSGFSIKSISYLLRMSEASLRMRKSRFKQQFEIMSEPLRSLFLDKMM